MPYTVRLCRDAAGWFATQQPIRPELVRAQVETDDATLAHQLLDVAQDLARRLARREDQARVAQAIARSPLFG